MDLEMKIASKELGGFKPGEVANLKYDTNHVTVFLKDSDNKAEALDWLDKISTHVATDILVRCIICEEYTPMNSYNYRAQGVFICDKCKAAILYIRKLLEDGGSVI